MVIYGWKILSDNLLIQTDRSEGDIVFVCVQSQDEGGLLAAFFSWNSFICEW